MEQKYNPWQKKTRRKIRQLLLIALPKKISHHWIRNSINLALPKASSGLTFEIASSSDDVKSALTLVQKNFQREGYAREDAAPIRITPYHLLPETLVIVVKNRGDIVATISIIPRTAFGIPLDNCMSLNSVAELKGKVVEISALAVCPSVRGQQGEVLFNLMKYLYHCNIDILKANTEIIGVNPKMRSLYEAILLFQQIPGAKTRQYNFVNGAPVVPMYFSLDNSREIYENAYKNKSAKKNLMDFFLITSVSQFSLPSVENLDMVLPQRRPDELRKMLSWDPGIVSCLSSNQQQKLEELFQPWRECAQLIREASNVRG